MRLGNLTNTSFSSVEEANKLIAAINEFFDECQDPESTEMLRQLITDSGFDSNKEEATPITY